jgi:hypothetical protein
VNDSLKSDDVRLLQLLSIVRDPASSPDNREAALGDLTREFPNEPTLDEYPRR